MANYISNKIVCTEKILNEYFIDYYPFGEKIEKPYITFNKLFGVRDISEYGEKYGEYIYYGFGFSYIKNDDGFIEIKFKTRWEFPITAIIKSLEIFKKDVIWYATDEGSDDVFMFKYNNENIEKYIFKIDENCEQWLCDNMKTAFDNNLDESDNLIWYYNNFLWEKCEELNIIQ